MSKVDFHNFAGEVRARSEVRHCHDLSRHGKTFILNNETPATDGELMTVVYNVYRSS